ncbi:hypothetical protein HNQ94_003820 [Salirhabdus euzebyi]|uniref:Uncharacterized protein n=1 Tax=Salirhabdus euzebyi TaxID=394506 RepID=A0A841QA79_9BACI|nr:hypothetical protein [Salirhabdus euzebyi]MBB6455320.1 hypothetical protein [Salirhabdus euzebyi]
MKSINAKLLSVIGGLILLAVVFYFLYSNVFPSNTSASGEPESNQVDKSENGLQLIATLSDIELQPNDKLVVDATVKNISGKALSYNGRCGVPIHLSVQAPDNSMYLLSNAENEGCPDIYDPNDIETFQSEEELTKQMTFYPIIKVNNATETDAPAGEYMVTISFRSDEGNALLVDVPIEVSDTNTDIISKQEAVHAAKAHPDVQKWFSENEEIGIEEEEHFLSDNIWAIAFHTKDFSMEDTSPTGKRLVVHVDSKTGDVTHSFTEEFDN